MPTIEATSLPEASFPLAGKSAIVARRYATALYDLAVSHHALTAVQEQMAVLREALQQLPELRRVINDPRVPPRAMQQLFATLTHHAQIGGIIGSFLQVIAKNRRAGLLPAIIAAFAAEAAHRAGELTVAVQSAIALSAAQKQAISEHMARATGTNITLDCTENPALLGGMILRYGSFQIDASLRGRLATLTHNLQEAQ